MKKILTFISISAMAFASMSCEKEQHDIQPEPLEVNTNNISGKWELVEWNGAPMAGGTYVYMDIERGKTYTMYQKTMHAIMHVP